MKSCSVCAKRLVIGKNCVPSRYKRKTPICRACESKQDKKRHQKNVKQGMCHKHKDVPLDPRSTFLCTHCLDGRRNELKFHFRYVKGKPEKCHVYLIHEEQSDFYKIGKARNVNKRLRNLEGGNPHQLTLVHSVSSKRGNWLEVELHDLFLDKRYRLEWFHFEPEDVPHVIAAMENGKEKKVDYILPLQTEFTAQEVFRRTASFL